MNSSSPIDPGSNGNRVFATTSWSRVVSATSQDSGEIESALAELCEIYWYPLYAFVRRKGRSPQEAEDITQAFFVDLLEKKKLELADSARGKFRTFLLSSLTNFMMNWQRDQSTQKRGGGKAPFSIDFALADERFDQQASHELTAERIFERTWAMELLSSAMSAVRSQYESTGKSKIFSSLESSLIGAASKPLKDIAAELEISEGSVKVALYRLRQRYGDQLRLQIAKTLADPQQVDEELKALFTAIAD